MKGEDALDWAVALLVAALPVSLIIAILGIAIATATGQSCQH